MKVSIQPDIHAWETRIAYGLLFTTPLAISWISYDTFLLPKFVWAISFAALWILIAGTLSAGNRHVRSPLDAPMTAMLGWFALSIALRYQSPIQFYTMLVLFSFIALFYLFRRIWSLGLSEERVAWCLMAVAAVLSIYGLAQDYGLDLAAYSGGVRDWRAKVIATLGNPNFLGGYLAIGLPLFVAFALRPKASWTHFIIMAIAIALMAACLTVTFCVGATIGLIIAIISGVCALLALRIIPRVSLLRSALVLLAIVSSASWYFLDNPYNSHGRSLFQEAMESPQWRTGMGARNFNWRTTKIMMAEEPLLGIGYGNYLAKHIHYQGLNYQRYGTVHDRDYVIPVDQPHFQILETASETGPVGVLFIGWLFFAWWKIAIQRIKQTKHPWFAWGAFLGVVVAVGHSMSSFPFHLPASSMIVVCLASYFMRSPQIQAPRAKQIPLSVMSAYAAYALFAIAIAGAHFLSDVFVRNANETQGYASIVHLQNAIALNPYQHRAHFLLGSRYIQAGRHKDAMRSLTNALRYQEDQTARRYLARIYEMQNDMDQAIKAQRRVIELNPVFPGHYRELAAMLRKAGQNAEAETMEAKAIQLEKEMEQKY